MAEYLVEAWLSNSRLSINSLRNNPPSSIQCRQPPNTIDTVIYPNSMAGLLFSNCIHLKHLHEHTFANSALAIIILLVICTFCDGVLAELLSLPEPLNLKKENSKM
jgi:hypothetical protein